MENRKSINLNAFNYIVRRCKESNDYYWFNQETNALEQVSIKSAVCNITTGSIVYNLAHRDAIRTVIAKADYESQFVLKLYESEEDYRKQNCVGTFDMISVWRLKHVLGSSFMTVKSDDGRSVSFISYALQNGEPIEINLFDYINEIIISYGHKYEVEYSVNYIDKSKTIDFQHIYKSKDDLFNFESVLVKNGDGTMKYTDAPMKILRLTEEQQKAVENFKAARKALKEAGVGLMFERDNYDFYAVNISGFEAINSDEPYHSFEEYADMGVLRIDELPEFFNIGFVQDGCFGEYTSMMCTLKDKDRK